jgi:hypothetical protein
VELLGRRHPGLEGAAAGHPQDPDHLDLAVAGLGGGGGHPSQGGSGSGLGVDRIRLAVSSAGAAVGAVDLEDLEAVGVGEAGQAGAVGAGAFDPDQETEAARQAEELVESWMLDRLGDLDSDQQEQVLQEAKLYLARLESGGRDASG